MIRRVFAGHWIAAGLAAWLCVMSTPAVRAQDVLAGLDAYKLVDGGANTFDFSVNPIPADFFTLGSEPFTGVVELEAAALDGPTPGPRVYRAATTAFSGDPATAVTDVAAVTMHLASTRPITINTSYGPMFYELYLVVEASACGGGQMALARTGDGGGMIVRNLDDGDDRVDTFWDVACTLEFVAACHCSSHMAPPLDERLELLSDVPWSYQPPAAAAVGGQTSNFFPGGSPDDPAADPAHLLLAGESLHLELALEGEDPPPSVWGDANLDMVVDIDDFIILKNHFGLASGATWGMGDFNGDEAVDIDDFVLQKNYFGQSREIPEPSSLGLLAVGGLAGLRRRR